VKRFLTAFILALAIHGLVFFLGDRWLDVFSPPPGPPKPVTISLAAVKHSRADKAPAGKKVQSAPKPHPIPPEIARPPKTVPMPHKPPPVAKTMAPQQPPTPEKRPLPPKPKKSLKRLTRTKPAAEIARPKPQIRQQQAPAPVRQPLYPKESGSFPGKNPQPPPVSSGIAAENNSRSHGAPTAEEKTRPSASGTTTMARPLYVKNSAPRYPRRARQKGFEGTVVLEVLVDENGKIKELKLFRSSGHAILDRAAVASVKKWLFAPGVINGTPSKMWVKVPIRFELN